MADELIDIVDENNTLLGIQKMKSAAHRDGLWHRTAHVWIYNSRGEILLQLRAKDKDLYPNLWDISAAGHLAAGEDVTDGAIRETQEEIGLKIDRNSLDFLEIRKTIDNYDEGCDKEFNYIYLLKFDGEIKDLIFEDNEVQTVKFIDTNTLEHELKNNSDIYVPREEYWYKIIDIVKEKTI